MLDQNNLIGIWVYWQYICALPILLNVSSMQHLNVYSKKQAAIKVNIFQLLQLAKK